MKFLGHPLKSITFHLLEPYSRKWDLKTHPHKIVYVIFTRRRIAISTLPVPELNGESLARVKKTKKLGDPSTKHAVY